VVFSFVGETYTLHSGQDPAGGLDDIEDSRELEG
jgi:hypothetical protein